MELFCLDAKTNWQRDLAQAIQLPAVGAHRIVVK
jgi:hypothetical protein